MGWCMACSRQGPLDGCGRGEHGSVVNLKCPPAALKQHCCVLPTRATIAQNWFAASRLREDFWDPSIRPAVRSIRWSASWAFELSSFVLAFVPGDYAVFDVDNAMSVFGDVMLVCDQHDGVPLGMQAIE